MRTVLRGVFWLFFFCHIRASLARVWTGPARSVRTRVRKGFECEQREASGYDLFALVFVTCRPGGAALHVVLRQWDSLDARRKTWGRFSPWGQLGFVCQGHPAAAKLTSMLLEAVVGRTSVEGLRLVHQGCPTAAEPNSVWKWRLSPALS